MNTAQEILRFSITGMLVVAADFGIYYFLIHLLPTIFSKAVSFTCAGIIGYFLNKYLVFKNNQTSCAEMGRFIFINLLALGLNVWINQILLESFQSSIRVALVTATAVTNIMIFVCFKWWVFKKTVDGRQQTKMKNILLVIFLTGGLGCSVPQRLNPLMDEQRAMMVNRYMAEFSSGVFKGSNIGPAIREVLMRLPADDLKTVMNRRRPVVFVEAYDAGTARFVSSSEMILTKNDVPAFQEGMTIVKISTALENGSPEAIQGIVAHELAHRVLDHVRLGKVSCQSEREANHLVKSWGFIKEYEAASKEYGRAREGSGIASCQE